MEHTVWKPKCEGVATLTTQHIAIIDFYGNPRIEDDRTLANTFYAIVVQWIDGIPLKQFISRTDTHISLPVCIKIVRILCEVVHDLKTKDLCHNDLHAENVMVFSHIDVLTDTKSISATVIDTGTLKTVKRRFALLEQWKNERNVLDQADAGQRSNRCGEIERRT